MFPCRTKCTSLQTKFILGISCIVIPVLGVIFFMTGLRNAENTESMVLNQARVLARQIVLTRQWVSDCGGVFVDARSPGAANTLYYLDDKLAAASGEYPRFTPSMVTKKLSNYSGREHLYHFRLASLNPMNEENEPNGFERAALHEFIVNNKQEYFQLVEDEQGLTFQYSAPLLVDKACLSCHRNFTRGSVGGCLSIFFPADDMLQGLRKDQAKLVGQGAVLISLTILTLFFLLRRMVIRPLTTLDDMAGEIRSGNLDARVSLRSGDEFEHLGSSFNTMGERLRASHQEMEEKVRQAVRDLSKANEELQKLDRIKTEFFADMSHELRSPITAIQGGLDYLRRTVGDETAQGYIGIMDKNVSRLVHLISDLFDLTKIEAGKISWSFEEDDLFTLVDEIIDLSTVQANRSGVAITLEGHGPLRVKMDMERIGQVLVNLLDNAIKFSSKGGSITVRLRRDQGMALVGVQDRGIGIPAENLERIFMRFHTLPSGKTRSRGPGAPKGTGLGLTISKKIVEAHGGRIWVESKPGEGSTFTFALPLQDGVSR